MNNWDFSGSKLKLSRAIHHRESLNSCLLDWSKREPYLLNVNRDIDTGDNAFQFSIIESIPSDIPLIIGDAVHNLRSALDFIAVEIVRKSSISKNISRVYFPFRNTRDELIIAVKKSGIEDASAAAADLIINRIKPYEGGDVFLWSLNEMSNADKHRLLLPTIFRIYVKMSLENGNKVWPVKIIADSNDVLTIPIVGTAGLNIKIQGDISKTQDIFFDETKLTKNIPFLHIPKLLWYISALIEQTIILFEGI